MEINAILKEKNYTVIDVRTNLEFMGGHVAGSVNIPLQELPHKLEDLKNFQNPLILCCASGGRSGQARNFLAQHGFNCINGGSWLDVNYLITKTI